MHKSLLWGREMKLEFKRNLLRNMMILSRINEIFEMCEIRKLKIMLLKGIAMILLFKDYIKEREIEDVDILV